MSKKFYSEDLNGRDQLGELSLDGRIILNWVSKCSI
jgi:hypothetical protein